MWCFHVNRRRIENTMQELITSGKKRKPRINIHKSFESYWFQLFRSELAAFAAEFRADISDIVIEVDADMRPTIQNWNIDGRYKGRAYELADAVAWFNQRGVEIQDRRAVDLRGRTMASMRRDLR